MSRTSKSAPCLLCPYELRHLVAHLIAARQEDMLHALLTATDEEGRNRWHDLKEGEGLNASYSSDLRSALAEAKARAITHADPRAWSCFTQYALIRASLNSRAARMPASFLPALVRSGLWTWETALDQAQNLPDALQRISALAAIYPLLPASKREGGVADMQKAFPELRAGPGDGAVSIEQREAVLDMAEAFRAAGDSTALLRLAQRCRAMTADPDSERLVVEVLLNCRDRVTPPFQTLAKALLREMEAPGLQARLLSLLPEAERDRRAQVLIACLDVEEALWTTADVLQELRTHVADAKCHRLAREALARKDLEHIPASVLVKFLPLVDDSLRGRISSALVTLWSGGLGSFELEDLLKGVELLPPAARRQFITKMEAIGWNYVRQQVCSVLAGFLSADEQLAFFERQKVACRTTDRFSMDILVYESAMAAPYLDDRGLQLLLDRILRMQPDRYQIKALIRAMSGSSVFWNRQTEVIKQLAGQVRGLAEDEPRLVAAFWKQAAPHLSPAEMRAVLRVLVRIEDGWELNIDLGDVLKCMEAGAGEEIVSHAAKAIGSLPARQRAPVLKAVAPYFTEDQRRELSHQVHPDPDMDEAFEAAAELAAQSRDPATRKRLIDFIETQAGLASDTRAKAAAQIHLLNAFPERRNVAGIQRCLSAIAQIEHLTNRAKALVKLGAWIEPRLEACISEMLEMAARQERDVVNRDVIKELAPHMPLELARETYHMLERKAGRERDEGIEIEALPEVGARLAQLGEFDAVLPFATRKKRRSRLNDELLVEMAPYLRGDLLPSLGSYYEEIQNDYIRESAIAAFCARAAELGFDPGWESLAMSLKNSLQRGESCAALALMAPLPQQDKLLKTAFETLLTMKNWYAAQLTVLISRILTATCDDRSRRLVVELTEAISTRERGPCVRLLHRLSCQIHRLWGAQGVLAMEKAIQRSVRWWQ